MVIVRKQYLENEKEAKIRSSDPSTSIERSSQVAHFGGRRGSSLTGKVIRALLPLPGWSIIGLSKSGSVLGWQS
jgi:hypothetical protein